MKFKSVTVPVPCEVVSCDETQCRIRTQQPLRAVTPGQIGALYRGEELCGGGIIRLEQQ